MKTTIKFRIGSAWLCLEGGAGRSAAHPDTVTVALRENRPNGRPGRRIAANPGTGRSEILALGLRLLDLAQRMTPETTWLEGQEERACVPVNFGAADRELVERLSTDRPIDLARHAYDGAQRLRSRMPILRATQCVLEQCDDETASNLHMLLAITDLCGRLPVTSQLSITSSGPAWEMDASAG